MFITLKLPDSRILRSYRDLSVQNNLTIDICTLTTSGNVALPAMSISLTPAQATELRQFLQSQGY